MFKYKLPKKLTLDYRKWRAGGDGKNRIGGKSETALLCINGRECCLGQFAEQAGVSRKLLMEKSMPASVTDDNEHLVTIQGLNSEYGTNSRFSSFASDINDNEDIDTPTRVRKLQSLCKKFGRTLKLKNFPQKIIRKLNASHKT